jgi:hypothetical protein
MASPEKRPIKRIRELTPLLTCEIPSTDSRLLGDNLNASVAAYPTTIAGPSSLPMQDDYVGDGGIDDGRVGGVVTSEGDDGKSVLFSEVVRLDEDKGEKLEATYEGEDDCLEEDEEEDYQEGGYVGEDQDPGALLEESHESADLAEPPPWLTEPQYLPSRSYPKPHTRIAEIRGRRRQVQVDENECIDGEVEMDMDGSYHSGDTEEYEMDHRPVLDRTAIKKDIERFVDGLDGMMDEQLNVRSYHVIDRLGEGEYCRTARLIA